MTSVVYVVEVIHKPTGAIANYRVFGTRQDAQAFMGEYDKFAARELPEIYERARSRVVVKEVE